MTPRPATCEGCPLNTSSTPGFCPDKIPTNPTIMIVAEAPGKNEIAQSEPLVGQSGFVLKHWLGAAVSEIKIAFEQNKVGLANTLRCLPKEVQGRPYPTGEDKRLAEAHCRQYDRWPDSAKTYILFGEHAQRLFFGEELAQEDAVDRAIGRSPKGVLGRVGRVMEKDGKRYIFCMHPAAILRNPAFVTHGQRAMEIAAGKAKVLEPAYESWESALTQLLGVNE